MRLPVEVLEKLTNLSGYDQMLEMDTISREYGLSLSEIEAELNVYKSNSMQNKTVPEVDFKPQETKEIVNIDNTESVALNPQYLSNPDQYRMKYNPSHQGVINQSQVTQAIICPTCSAPLGIPNVRPIKVTCPQCLTESTFIN